MTKQNPLLKLESHGQSKCRHLPDRLDISQVAPDCVAYVGDRATIVDVARGPGIRGIVHKTFESTRDALAAMGLILDGAQPGAHR